MEKVIGKFWREEDDSLAVSVNGKTTYYSMDTGIEEAAAELGLTPADFEYLA